MKIRLALALVVVAATIGACEDGSQSAFTLVDPDAGPIGPTEDSGQFGPLPDGGGNTDAGKDVAPIDCDADPSFCLPPGVCGDGVPGLGESCDDGNTANGDGCSSSCQIEAPYWACIWGSACIDARDCSQMLDAGITDGGCVAPPKPVVCGDGFLDPGEACDDGNVSPGDGCSFDCKVIEANFACPTPGAPCVSTMVCGDGKITGTEQCDDKNAASGDGCSSTCQLEAGWTCPVPGTSCNAAACGDGLVAGTEQCDDHNTTSGDGCSATCTVETHTVVTAPGVGQPPKTVIEHYSCVYPVIPLVPLRQVCTKTVCGNGVIEPNSTEQCDDGNTVAFDGCSPNCELEPSCPNGACVAVCGDGLLFDFDANGDGKPDEACDDGNVRNGDGCSSTCTVEPGYQCATQVATPPAFVDVPIVMRDFKYWSSGSAPENHPDFERYGCPNVTLNLVKPTLTNRVPLFNSGDGGSCGTQLTSAVDFTDWYKDIDVPVVGNRRSKRIDDVMIRMTRNGLGDYVFDSAADEPYKTLGGWFPIDGRGWGNQSNGHNFAFTTEFRYWFTYDAATSPQLDFSGDDDVWVFIDNQLALDLGGLHQIRGGTFVLDPGWAGTHGLVDKHLYEVALFHAERHTTASNFKLTLSGFVKKSSVCTQVCGDGIKTRGEQCDNGAANITPAPYGGCTATCTLGPYCGDKTVTTPPEACDDGTNLTSWTATSSTTLCAPGCVKPPYCGDGAVQGPQERCDNGAANADGLYGGCQTNCTAGPRCGDAVVQAAAGEQCDNGFNVTSYVRHPSGGECGPGCKSPTFCGDGVTQFPLEQCDRGGANTNDGSYGSCTLECALGPRCGDGVVQPPEQCDDGNRVNGDGCSAACTTEGGPPK